MKNSLFQDFTKGIWKENPVLVLLLGTCPTLALTSSAANGLGMGIATTCVLTGSNLVISLIASITPKKIRIPVYIVVIAAFVTVVDLLLQAYALICAFCMFSCLFFVLELILNIYSHHYSLIYKDIRHKSNHWEAHIYFHSERSHVIFTEKNAANIKVFKVIF